MPIDVDGVSYDLTDQAQHMMAPWNHPTPLPFGPGAPILPIEAEDSPRVFQYTPGINLTIMPRSGFNLTPFKLLRNLAMACKEVRLNIELIKREIRALEWEIVPTKEKDPLADAYTGEIAALQEFIEQPDGQSDFDAWTNALLEEMLVTDALCVYPDTTVGGDLTALELIDGTTVRPVLDFRGRVCAPPAPAYIQVMWGAPRSWYTRDALIYRPYNQSVQSPYGTSPIEYIMLMVNLALRRDTYHVGYFTEGNVPEALVGAPSTWQQPQIDTFQNYWDNIVAGKVAQQRRLHFIPLEGGRGNVPVYEFRRDNIDTTAQDEWLMRVACWAFGNSPGEFGITGGQGLGGAGFAQGMENVQYRSMLGPTTQFLARFWNNVIQRRMKKMHLTFRWKGLDPQEDELKAAQVDQIYIGTVYTAGYVQDRLGVPQEYRIEAPTPGDPGQNADTAGLEATVDPVELPDTEGLEATVEPVDLEGAQKAAFFRQGAFDDYSARPLTPADGTRDASGDADLLRGLAKALDSLADNDLDRWATTPAGTRPLLMTHWIELPETWQPEDDDDAESD